MSISVWKDFSCGLPTGDTADVTVRYFIRADDDEFLVEYPDVLARAELTAKCDPVYDGRSPTHAEVDRVGPNLFEGTVTYSDQEWEYNFAITTQETQVNKSFSTIGQYVRSGATAANFNQLIGVTRDGVQGTTVQIPVYSWNETHRLPVADVDATYRKNLRNLVGKMNQATFRDCERGEALLVGVQGGIARGQSRYTLNFEFMGSPNITGLTIDGITGISKLGWDYLWTFDIEYPDLAAGRLVRRIEQINVERIFEFGDFRQMKLPG